MPRPVDQAGNHTSCVGAVLNQNGVQGCVTLMSQRNQVCLASGRMLPLYTQSGIQ